MPTDEQTSGGTHFRWTAMTLRGIGSYLHGARLELRPLTILCGANGSGKSTWIRALDILKESAAARTFPFEWGDAGADPLLGYTNAYLAHKYDDNPAALSEGDEETFGPVGSVGLFFSAPSAVALPALSAATAQPQPQSPLLRFLFTGRCAAKTEFALFFTNPRRDVGGEPDYPGGFEIRMNGRERIRFHIRRIKYVRRQRTLRQELQVWFSTRAASGGATARDKLFFEGCLTKEGVARKAGGRGAKHPITAPDCNAMSARVRQLTQALLAGVFHVAAVRPPETRWRLDEATEREQLATAIKARYVGITGEYTHLLRAQYAMAQMRQPQPPYGGAIDSQYRGLPAARWIHSAVVPPIEKNTMRAYVWPRIPRETREAWERFLREHQGRLHQTIMHECTERAGLALRAEFVAMTCNMVNTLLEARCLYDPAIWPEPGPEARFYIDKGMKELHPRDLARLNRILIDAALGLPSPSDFAKFVDDLRDGMVGLGFVHDVFVSKWLQHVTGICSNLLHGDLDPGEKWDEADGLPAGYLVPGGERPMETGDDQISPDRLSRFSGPTFRGMDLAATPRNLSSGFHQVLPLIVQAGLMRQYELCAFENPEVHLHPASQAKIAEFLVSQAAIGKFMLVETHSDVLVMRTMRAILEETVPEGFVRIAFTSLEEQQGLTFSRLQDIQMDAKGRVANWPKDFMDASMNESQRMLDKLYGTPEDDGDE